MTIDVHAHCLPAGLVDTLRAEGGRYGIEIVTENGRVGAVIAGRVAARPIREDLVDSERRLKAMEAAGVDVQVLSSWIDMTAYALGADTGVRYARMFNELLAATRDEHPDRFRAVATVPLQAPDRAATELHHAVANLGMDGVEIATTVDGRDLDAPELGPFWKAAEDLQCLVVVHPYKSLAGRDVNRYFLENLVGNPAETTIAVASLIFGGVFERHPGLRVCLVHGGGFAPYQAGRWDRAFSANARGAAVNLTSPPSATLRRLYYDTVLHSPQSLRHLADFAGPEQVVLGSDYPFEMGDPDPVGTVQAIPNLTAAERDLILAGNLKRLLEAVRR